MAQRNFANSRIYTGHVMPVSIDCSFTVAATNGKGITGLTGAYVQNVFMHTSTTAAAGNSNPMTPAKVITNPNPASGTIIIQLQDVFSQLYSMDWTCCSPNSGSDIKIDNTALTAGVAYVITTVGDASTATWQGVGLPVGITPAIGVPFIATGTGGSGNTSSSRVQITAAAGSNLLNIEVVGNPTLALPSTIVSNGFGSQIILQCRNDNTTDVPRIATPADGTVIKLKFLLSNSSITIQGS